MAEEKKEYVVVKGKGNVSIDGKAYFEGETIPDNVSVNESLVKRGIVISKAEFDKAEAKKKAAEKPKEVKR